MSEPTASSVFAQAVARLEDTRRRIEDLNAVACACLVASLDDIRTGLAIGFLHNIGRTDLANLVLDLRTTTTVVATDLRGDNEKA